jgi:hypothetical protein
VRRFRSRRRPGLADEQRAHDRGKIGLPGRAMRMAIVACMGTALPRL